MISALLDGLPKEFCDNWNERFRMFQCNETVLPSWQIRFHHFLIDESGLSNHKLGEVGHFCYYTFNQTFWIFSHYQKQSFAIQMTSDFSAADFYFNNFQDLYTLDFGVHELIRQAYRYRVLMNDGLILHSSAISYHGDGIAFFGHSGAGKSTQANFWKSHNNAEILSYDQNCVSIRENSCLISSTPWGGKEKRYVNKTAFLKAVVFVQKSFGENRVERFTKAEAFSSLFLYNYIFPLDQRVDEKLSNLLEGLASSVPVYKLFCTYGNEAVDVLHSELFTNLSIQ